VIEIPTMTGTDNPEFAFDGDMVQSEKGLMEAGTAGSGHPTAFLVSKQASTKYPTIWSLPGLFVMKAFALVQLIATYADDETMPGEEGDNKAADAARRAFPRESQTPTSNVRSTRARDRLEGEVTEPGSATESITEKMSVTGHEPAAAVRVDGQVDGEGGRVKVDTSVGLVEVTTHE
jgi:hypothetical protein